jgi:hypothetical protein
MAIQTRNNIEESFKDLETAVEGWNKENPGFVLVLVRDKTSYIDVVSLANEKVKETVYLEDFGRRYSVGVGRRGKRFEYAESTIETVGRSLKFMAEMNAKIAARRDDTAKAREAHRLDVVAAVETIREMGIRSDDRSKLYFLKELGASAFVIKVILSDGIEVKVPGTNVEEAALKAKKVIDGYLS